MLVRLGYREHRRAHKAPGGVADLAQRLAELCATATPAEVEVVVHGDGHAVELVEPAGRARLALDEEERHAPLFERWLGRSLRGA